ncbi:ABC transporter ATP-binding protein [Shouchella shacheensis]|uniref:ABC transporter ATP-binding protein n=1 Tax=Shouchella shacheensis TaxID=1649580 RepID=UPI00074032C0
MGIISLERASKKYESGKEYAVRDFTLDIEEQEFIVFVGPSGCGKSTTLRMIAGLEEISEGSLVMQGKQMNATPPKDRGVAMVFQNYALFPHLTVFDNLAYGMKMRRVPKQTRKEEVEAVAELLGLEELLDRKPKALSGGQRQRVALGRAVVRGARVFLMDEPLSNLDAKLRVRMRAEILKLHKNLKTTTIYVTHDQTEAMTMASRIVVLKDGDIQQIGTPLEVYNHPVNLFVASFLGAPATNFIKGKVKKSEVWIDDATRLSFEEKRRSLLESRQEQDIIVGIRPEDVVLMEEGIACTVEHTEQTGVNLFITVRFNGQPIIVRLSPDEEVNTGDCVRVGINPDKCHLFDAETEEVIRA